MFNYQRIAKARNVRGISQTKLAELLEISHTTLNFIENNKVVFKEEVANQIANVLEFPMSFFKKSSSRTRISKFYYRKRNAFPASKLVPLESRIDIMRDIYVGLLESVEIPYTELPKIPVHDKNTPEDIAHNMRLFLGLDDGPIEKPISLIEKLGIPVVFLDVDSDKFSGMTVETDINMPMIMINKNMPNDHIKHTLYHELGHLIMHIPFSEDPEFYDKFNNKETLEKEADRFAGAFLVPEIGARTTFRPFTYSNLTNLKIYWKVSKSSLIMRARQLGIIPESKSKTLFVELSRFGERKNEKTPISIDYPILMNRIITYHTKEIGLGYEEIANEIGGIRRSDFVDWFDLKEGNVISLN